MGRPGHQETSVAIGAMIAPFPSGYVMFRDKVAPLLSEDGVIFIQLGDSRGVLKLTTEATLPANRLTSTRPVLMELNGCNYEVEFVCKDPLAQVREDRATILKHDLKPVKVAYRREGTKTYRVMTDGDTEYWYWNGKLHRENDKPAIIQGNFMKAWYLNGVLHRDDDKPAYIAKDGVIRWHRDGDLHRDNGPAYLDRAKNHIRHFSNGVEVNAAPSKGRTEAIMYFNEAHPLMEAELSPEEQALIDDSEQEKETPTFVKSQRPKGMNSAAPQKDPGYNTHPRTSIRRGLAQFRKNRPLPVKV